MLVPDVTVYVSGPVDITSGDIKQQLTTPRILTKMIKNNLFINSP
jgi:hypothetical protein